MAFAALALALLSSAAISDDLRAFTPLSFVDGRAGDYVELRNGGKLTGRVVYEDETRVVLREGSKLREIDRADVKSVVSRAANAREALGRWLELKPKDPNALLDIVRFCERMGLTEDAQAYARIALVANPADNDAHEVLGHQRRSDGWAERVGTRWVSYGELESVRASWKTSWELASSHYRLRTNLEMATAIGALLDLECFYRSFFDRFGRELTLHEVLDPMDAQIHATRDSYPIALVGRIAYYDPSLATVIVDASSGLERGMLIHEATHQILRSTGDRSRGVTSDIPAWLDEGLAEYMRACMTGPSGRMRFDDKLVLAEHFKEQASAKDPYDLARLLTFDTGEFHTESKSDLRYAEAYTLVQFCLHGEGGKHASRFFDFVRSAYKSKGSPTHFKAALGIEGDAFEDAWTSYVRSKAR
jgi:tetratricopeptide (TPR) repeat protein